MLRLGYKAARALCRQLKSVTFQAAVALGAGSSGEPFRSTRLLRAAAIILPVSLLTWWAIPQVTLVATPSIDAWMVREEPGPIRRGDLVSFSLVHPLAGPKPVNVTKIALCMPGDRIEMVERRGSGPRDRNAAYFCNGVLLGTSQVVTRLGQPLQHWQPSFRFIPEGMIYVGSTHPRGFDSRYYGPIALTRLTRMVRVL